MGVKYGVGTKHANWTVLQRIDGLRLKCVCGNCGRVAVVTRICLLRNSQLGAIGCNACRSRNGPKREIIDGKVVCCDCGRLLPVSEFNPCRRNTISKIESYCRSCKRDQRIHREYGLSPSDHADIVATAKGRCQICRRKTRTLVVDHDHATLIVRGVICRKCNSGLGFFRDSPETLERAIQYLNAVTQEET